MTETWVKPVNAAIVAGGEFHADRGAGHTPRYHQGVDLGCSVGTNVLASDNGRVTFAGMSGGYGNLLSILHPNGDITKYAHLSKFNVPFGAAVLQGASIGLSGGAAGAPGSGDSTGPHLHHEHLVAGVPVDPVPYWSGITAGATTANPAGAVSSTVSAVDGFGKVAEWITTPANWVRVGIFVLGGLLIAIAVIKFAADTDTGQAVIAQGKQLAKTATTVAEVAAI